MQDEYHPDLRQEDDRANFELHGELENRAYAALSKIADINDRLHILSDTEFSALCFACGLSPYPFRKRA